MRLKKESKVVNHWAGFPKYCKFDGKELTKTRRVLKAGYNEYTGRKDEFVVYGSFCPDWQNETDKHTNYWGLKEWEYIDE